MKHYLSVDYDDTIVDADYPRSGVIKQFAKECINDLYDKGFQILIWTCRTKEALQVAKDYLEECGVKYHYINENHPDLIELYGCDTRKQSACVYIDDKGLLGIPESWLDIHRLILQKFNYG